MHVGGCISVRVCVCVCVFGYMLYVCVCVCGLCVIYFWSRGTTLWFASCHTSRYVSTNALFSNTMLIWIFKLFSLAVESYLNVPLMGSSYYPGKVEDGSCVVLISCLYYAGHLDQPCDLFDGAILEQVLR